MELSEFEFELPEELIALRPVRPRSAARLLVARAGSISDMRVRDFPELLRPGDMVVFNDTKVVPSRLAGTRLRFGEGQVPTGSARVSLDLVRAVGEGRWEALARPAKRLRPGDLLRFRGGLEAEVLERDGPGCVLQFGMPAPKLERALHAAGSVPLPPYIESRRQVDESDISDYQTVFAAKPGAVAAPTAALHFDRELISDIKAAGADVAFVTLHVGPGTFLPVKSERIEDHRMHAEWGELPAAAAAELNDAKRRGGRIIAVGTTALRLLETAAGPDGLAPWRGETDIFIGPGYRFKAVDALLTNFHLPGSTLIILVSAFIGHERMKAVYAHAIRGGYRFYSYGDASLLFRTAGNGI